MRRTRKKSAPRVVVVTGALAALLSILTVREIVRRFAAPTVPHNETLVVPGTGSSYKVRAGDTLYTISQRTLGSGSRYRELIDANPGLEYGVLKVDMTLRIPVDPSDSATR